MLGGIGSGKSRVAEEFKRHGAAVISGDPLGHEALRQPELRRKVIERFGPEIAGLNREIDRGKLAKIVFADLHELRALEEIVFPWIKEALNRQVAKAQADSAIRLVVVDAAVMLEAGWDEFCDRTVFVDAPTDQRVARLARQRGWTAQDMLVRSQAQMPLQDKAARADAVIDNSGPPTALATQVTQLLKRWHFPVALKAEIVDNS